MKITFYLLTKSQGIDHVIFRQRLSIAVLRPTRAQLELCVLSAQNGTATMFCLVKIINWRFQCHLTSRASKHFIAASMMVSLLASTPPHLDDN